MSDNKSDSKKMEYNTLLSVLANGSTENARQLLKKHSGQDAKNTTDLQVKLARVYALSPKKYDIEKEFAEIHPHKDFILKYLASKPVAVEEKQILLPETPSKVEDKVIVEQKIISDTYTGFNGHPPCGSPNCQKCAKYFSSCEGNSNCNCNKTSNACGCGGSSFNGISNANNGQQKPHDYMGLIGLVAVVGLTFFVLSKTTSSK